MGNLDGERLWFGEVRRWVLGWEEEVCVFSEGWGEMGRKWLKRVGWV